MELPGPRGLARGGQAGDDDELCARPAVVSLGSITRHTKDRGEKGIVLTGIVSLNEPRLVRRPPGIAAGRYVQSRTLQSKSWWGSMTADGGATDSRTGVPDSRSHRLGTGTTRYLETVPKYPLWCYYYGSTENSGCFFLPLPSGAQQLWSGSSTWQLGQHSTSSSMSLSSFLARLPPYLPRNYPFDPLEDVPTIRMDASTSHNSISRKIAFASWL